MAYVSTPSVPAPTVSGTQHLPASSHASGAMLLVSAITLQVVGAGLTPALTAGGKGVGGVRGAVASEDVLM